MSCLLGAGSVCDRLTYRSHNRVVLSSLMKFHRIFKISSLCVTNGTCTAHRAPRRTWVHFRVLVGFMYILVFFIMKRKFKIVMTNNNINKTKNHLSLLLTEHKKTTTYDIESQVQKCGGIKQVEFMTTTSPLDNWISNCNTIIKKH